MPCTHYFLCREHAAFEWNDSALLFSNFSVCPLGAGWNDRRTIEIGAKCMFYFVCKNTHTPYFHDLVRIVFFFFFWVFGKSYCSKTMEHWLLINFRRNFGYLFISRELLLACCQKYGIKIFKWIAKRNRCLGRAHDQNIKESRFRAEKSIFLNVIQFNNEMLRQ